MPKKTRQVALRLPLHLLERVEAFEHRIQRTGLRVTKSDLIRLLLSYALDTCDGDLSTLLRVSEADIAATNPGRDDASEKRRNRS